MAEQRPRPSREAKVNGPGVLDGAQGIPFLFSGKVNLKDTRIPGKQSDKTLSVPLPHLVARTGERHASLPHGDSFPGISCWALGLSGPMMTKIIYVFLVSEEDSQH